MDSLFSEKRSCQCIFRIVPESWYAAEGGWYYNNGLMLFPPMALIIVGCIIWVHRSRNKDLQEK